MAIVTYSIVPLTSTTSINGTTLGDQYSSDAVALPTGGALSVYGTSTAIYMRRVTPAGVASGAEILVNTAGGVDAGPDHFAQAVVLANGSVVVTWADNAAANVIHYRVYDSSLAPVTGQLDFMGVGASFHRPDVAALAGGGFVIVGQQDFSATDHDLYARKFDNLGVPGALITIDASKTRDT